VKLYSGRGYFLYRRQLFSTDQLDVLNSIFGEHRAAQADKRETNLTPPTSRTGGYWISCLPLKCWTSSSASWVLTSCCGPAVFL